MDAPKIDYVPESVGFAEGVMIGSVRSRAAVGAGKPLMRVDTDKAKKIIAELIDKGRKLSSVELGLDGDWGLNSTVIWDGEHHEYAAYTHSLWATPTLIAYFEDGPSETYECWAAEEYLRSGDE